MSNKEKAGEEEGEEAVIVKDGEEEKKEKKSMIKKIRNLPPLSVHTSFQGLYAPI